MNKILLGTWQTSGSYSESTCQSWTLVAPTGDPYDTLQRPYMGGTLLKAQAVPNHPNKYSPRGPGPLQTLVCLGSFLFPLAVRKCCRIFMPRVDPVPQLEDYRAISLPCPYHTQRDRGTEKTVSSRSYHRNVTQKKISPFSSLKTGKITLWGDWKIEHRTEIFKYSILHAVPFYFIL